MPYGNPFAPAQIDFQSLANLPQQFLQGQQATREMQLRRDFQGGIPTLPDGSPDVMGFAKAYGQAGFPDQAAQMALKAQPQTQFMTVQQPYGGAGLVGIKEQPGQPPQITPYNLPGMAEGEEDIKNIADSIESGKQPPEFTGMGRSGRAGAVRAELAKRGFDLTNSTLEWKSAQKQIQSLSGPQMVRYAGLAHSVTNTIDEVNNLAQQMKLSGITPLNRAKLTALVNLAGNTPEGQLATRYLAATNTLKEEFANLAQGGYAPTEPAWALANQQINADYGVDQLSSSLIEVQRLINYRLNAIPNFNTLGPGAANRYIGGAGEQPTGDFNAPPVPGAMQPIQRDPRGPLYPPQPQGQQPGQQLGGTTSNGIKWSIAP